MREMRTRTDQSAQTPRFSFAMVLSTLSAILFLSGCHHQVSPEQFAADVKARTEKIQNDPSLTPQQKQQAILQLQVRTGQLPPTALNQAPR